MAISAASVSIVSNFPSGVFLWNWRNLDQVSWGGPQVIF